MVTSGEHLGDYRLDALLGRGGMGEVYRAYDLRRGRIVALKLLPPQFAGQEQFRERFVRESQLVASLQHPHIVPIHDWGQIGQTLFLDMRLVEGQTLGQLIGTARLDPARAVRIIEQVAGALDAAHAAGLIHRDVKPDNILVGADDFCYLLDFGLAQAVGDSRLTQTGAVIGSIAYMAPERFSDEPLSAAADTYALTCVLYECLAGKPPFPGTDIGSTLRRHLLEEPPRLGNGFDDVIARGMAKDPGARFAACGDLAAAAQAVLSPSAERTQIVPNNSRPLPPAPAAGTLPYSSAPNSAAPYPSAPNPSASYPPASHPPASYPPGGSSTGTGRGALVVAIIAVAVLIAAAGVGGYLLISGDGDSSRTAQGPVAEGTNTPAGTVDCDFTDAPPGRSGGTVDPPARQQPSTGTATIDFTTNLGPFTIELDRAAAPCNTAALIHLADSGYYDSGCARLSDYILVCAAGAAGPDDTDIQDHSEYGPGWTSPNELPVDLPDAPGMIDALGRQQVTYPRGAVGITNPGAQRQRDVAAGAGSFFIVLKPIITAPLYTMVGTVTAGMPMIERAAAAGFTPPSSGRNFGFPRDMVNLLEASTST